MANIFSDKTAPGPPGHVLLGNLLKVRQDRLKFLSDLTSQFGDVVRFRMGPKILHLINHPEYIKYVLEDNHKNYHKGIGLAQAKPLLGEGLLTSEGKIWENQRRLVQPAFHRQQIADFVTVINDATLSTLNGWKNHTDRGQSLDVAEEMMHLTLSILCRTLFSTDIAAQSKTIYEALRVVLEYAIHSMTSLFNLPESFPTPRNRNFRKALCQLDKFVYDLINERRYGNNKTDDLLSILLLATDQETNNRMSEKQLRDQVLTILLAGHETTANLLAWIWYLLSRNSMVEHQLNMEVTEVLNGRTPTFHDLYQLKYTKMVIEESMRLYPPVWLIPRKAIGQDEIGGYYIPEGSEVLISPYTMHRHPNFWENPDEFDPKRFTSEQLADRPRYTYFPFGGGSRYCIGSSFAMMETQLVIAMIVQKYRLRLVSDYLVKPEPLLTLRPHHGILMTLQEV